MSMLFRQEAIDTQSQRLVGTITLAQPLSIKLTTTIIVLVAATMLAFLFNGHYTRKESVQGFLRPDKGVIKSYASRSGTVNKIFVSEGDFVTRGMPLVGMISRRSMDSGEELSDKVIAELTKQIALVRSDEEQLHKLETQELDRLNQRIELLTDSRQIILTQKYLLDEKSGLLSQQFGQHTTLYESGFMSKADYHRQKERQLVAKQEVESLKHTLLRQNDELQQLVFEQKKIPQQYQIRFREMQRMASDLNRQLNEVQNSYSHVIKATHSGTITAIQIDEGESLTTPRPLLSILPENAELVAELLLPTRSAGFIQVGDVARLRFDAFPHQRFGFIESKITRIDKALITQGEVNLPIPLREPVYRMQGKLKQQVVQAFGKDFSLKSGMLFHADIILDRRTLIQWLLDPIYSLSGRIS